MKLTITAIALTIAATSAIAQPLQNHPTPRGWHGQESPDIDPTCYIPRRADGDVAGPGDDVAYWNNITVPQAPGGSDEEEVTEIFDVEIDVFTPRKVVETVARPVGFGETFGPAPERDNLTSLGLDANGNAAFRIRSATPQTVSIARAGGGAQQFTVGAGDTIVNLGSPGTFIMSSADGRFTKATGPQEFSPPTVTDTRKSVVIDRSTKLVQEARTRTVTRFFSDVTDTPSTCPGVADTLRAAGWN